MRNALRFAILTLVFCGAARAQCVPGGLAVIVNKANSVESLSMAQLRRLVLGDVRTWQDRKPVNLIARDQSTKTFECMISTIVRQSVAEYRRYIINAEFRGDEPMVIQTAESDGAAAKLVAKYPGALAVVEAKSVPAMGDSVKILRVDGKAVGQTGYPL